MKIPDQARQKILTEPEIILDDSDVMRALTEASERNMGSNIVDLRGMAMDRLEARLDRLEATHRTVVAAAYENVSGTNRIHRAVLLLLQFSSFEALLDGIDTHLRETLSVDSLKLIIETDDDEIPNQSRKGFTTAPKAFISDYLSRGRRNALNRVVLRKIAHAVPTRLEPNDVTIRSEACLLMTLENTGAQAMLHLGARQAEAFGPTQATELLGFFAQVFEARLNELIG